MTYVLRFFTNEQGEEKFLKEYNYEHLPYIPHRKEHIFIDEECYCVKNISFSYDLYYNTTDLTYEMWFEIMLDRTEIDKEWWE